MRNVLFKSFDLKKDRQLTMTARSLIIIIIIFKHAFLIYYFIYYKQQTTHKKEINLSMNNNLIFAWLIYCCNRMLIILLWFMMFYRNVDPSGNFPVESQRYSSDYFIFSFSGKTKVQLNAGILGDIIVVTNVFKILHRVKLSFLQNYQK